MSGSPNFKLNERWTLGTVRDRRDILSIRFGLYQKQQQVSRYIVFLNGRTEFIEKYNYLPEDLNLPADVGIVTWDHRGQGASGGARAFVDSYDDYVFDGHQVLKQIVADKPYDILTHSMGGLVALHGIHKGLFKPERLLMLSPLLGLDNHKIPKQIAMPLSRLLTRLHLGPVSSGSGKYDKKKFAGNRLTQDFERYQRILSTPYPIPGATFGWVAATFEAMEMAFSEKTFRAAPAKTYILGGSRDTVVDPEAWQRWAKGAHFYGQHDIAYEMYQDARHELLSEIETVYKRTVEQIRWMFELK